MTVRALYWLDQRDWSCAIWHGRRGDGRPHDAVDVVVDQPPRQAGELVTGSQVGDGADSYEAARNKVLVIGIPVME